MKVKDLKQDGHNYRRHSDRNKALIKKSVEECGLGRSVVIDADGVLIAGNGVASVLDKHTPVRVVETDGSELVVVKRTDLHEGDVKRKKLAMADNAAADSVEWDVDALQELNDYGVNLDDWDLHLPTESGIISPNDFGEDFELPNGDKAPFQKITFQLADKQADIIKNAIDLAKHIEEYKHLETFGNSNSNGNAIYLIVKQWVDAKKLK